jgi:hypothetical protein
LKTYHKLNFHKHTYCEFKFVELTFFKVKAIHFSSKSGSKYFYVDEGVYRYSNHWGRVANCRWKIKGIEDYKNQNYYVGFANWSDFFPLNSTERVFYLKVTSEGDATIVCDKNKNSSNYLMNLSFAFKRQKEIKSLFKNDKWAKYYDEDIDELRRKLINGLITSNKSLQVLKTELNV